MISTFLPTMRPRCLASFCSSSLASGTAVVTSASAIPRWLFHSRWYSSAISPIISSLLLLISKRTRFKSSGFTSFICPDSSFDFSAKWILGLSRNAAKSLSFTAWTIFSRSDCQRSSSPASSAISNTACAYRFEYALLATSTPLELFIPFSGHRSLP